MRFLTYIDVEMPHLASHVDRIIRLLSVRV